MMHAGLVSLGGYLPAKKIPTERRATLFRFLRTRTLLPPEYVDMMEQTGTLPGRVETNHDGWGCQPWFDAWVRSLPPKKRADPFQGAKERRRVPMDPLSVRESVVAHPMLSSDAETIAGALALVNGEILPETVDLVLVHSQTPDVPLPHNVSLVQHKLKLDNAGAYGVDTCCSSFVTMLEIAESLVRAEVKKTVLIIAGYIDSHVNDKSEYFSVDCGDAAVAGVVSKVDEGYGYLASHSTSHGSRHKGIIFQRRSPRLLRRTNLGPSYAQEFTTFFDPDACKEIASKALEDMTGTSLQALGKAGLSVGDIDMMVTHQPVSWAAHAWRNALGVPKEKFYESFEKYGNIANCAAATNLLEALEQGLVKEKNTALIASSGAGENHIAVVERISPRLVKSTRLLGE